MSGPRFLPVLLMLAAITASAQNVGRNRLAQGIDDRQTAVIRGTAHPLARPDLDQGRVDGAMKIQGATMIFKPSAAQQRALEQLLKDQQDVSSPNYHKWLTPEEFADRFGMTPQDISEVVAWLQSQGLTVERVSRSRLQVSFTGTVTQIETVFRTEFHHYVVDGEEHFANATDLAIPAALAGVVRGFGNLSSFRLKPRNVHVREAPAPEAAPRFTSNLSGNHFLAPDDFATIYDLKPVYAAGFDGTGQKLAVVGQTAISLTDIDAFRAASGLAKNDPQLLLMPGTGTSTVSTSDLGEADLDLEWSGAVAKNANIIFVYTGSNKNFGAFDALQYAIDNKLAPVISISYGNCEQNIGNTQAQSMATLAQQANAQGQTITAASGDSGAADCENNAKSATHGFAVDIPAALPGVTGVGGGEFSADTVITNPPQTTIYWNATNNASNGSALQYIPEMAWNDTVFELANGGTLAASGGGASVMFSKPSWQTGPGVPADGRRDVPDISLNGSPDHDGYLFCTQGGCVNGFRNSSNNLSVVGGTSAGAPTFAGIVALLLQASKSTGLGNVNPTLYQLAATNQNNEFHDITSGDNIVPCTQGTSSCPAGAPFQYGFKAGPRYDLVTGLGSIDADKLVSAWTAFAPSADYSLWASIGTVSAPGQQTTSTITVESMHGFAGTVALSCAPPASSAQISCSLNPASVNLTSSVLHTTATLTISTVAPHALVKNVAGNMTSGWLTSGGGMIVCSVVLLGIPKRGVGRRLLLSLTVIALLAGIGCGGGGGSSRQAASFSNPGTPAGTYSVTVTATSGGSSHTISVPVVVN